MEAKLIEEDLNPPVRHLSQLEIVRFYYQNNKKQRLCKKKKKTQKQKKNLQSNVIVAEIP